MNIVVLGSGGWGTAAAMLLSDNGHTVALWSHDPKKAELLDKTRENPLLKGVRIPVLHREVNPRTSKRDWEYM